MAQETKQLIKHTFIELLEENTFDKITVTDIVQKCNVNRNTFYYHFQDIFALVDEILKEETENILSIEVSYETWIESFMSAIEFVRSHKRAVFHLYNSEFKTRLEEYLYEVIRNNFFAFIQASSKELEICEEKKLLLSQFYASALLGFVADWFKNKMEYDFEATMQDLYNMLEGNIYLSLKRISKN